MKSRVDHIKSSTDHIKSKKLNTVEGSDFQKATYLQTISSRLL